jgi:hypothetical protein
MTLERRNSSLLGNGGKQVTVEMNTQATIEEPVYKQRIGKHNNRCIVGKDIFCGERPRGCITRKSGSRDLRSTKMIEKRRQEGIRLSKENFMCATVTVRLV